MSEPTKAVFLSYASQDAEAARRICESLRSGGVEVWFDVEGGLETGDEWDQKIRKQIKECVLFIPIISANTQVRHEGYFRIEWDLAAERARGIASGVPVILPVMVDDTREPDALVPDRFRAVQWTRLKGGGVPPEVRARFLKLWSHRTGVLKHEAAHGMARSANAPTAMLEATAASSSHAWAIAGGALVVLVAAVLAWWQPWRRAASPPPEAATASAAKSPVPPAATPSAKTFPRDPELKRAWDIFLFSANGTAEDFALAEDIVKGAVARHPTDPETVIVYAWLNDAYLNRGFDLSEDRYVLGRRYAERAVQLAPDEPEALAALGQFLSFRRADLARAEQLLRRAIELNPREPRFHRALAYNVVRFAHPEEALQIAEHAAELFPTDALVHYELALHYRDAGRIDAMERTFDRTLALAPLGAAMIWKSWIVGWVHGDVAGMRPWLDQVPASIRMTDRALIVRYQFALLAQQSADRDEILRALQAFPGTMLRDFYYTGPKALLIGDLFAAQGKRELAKGQYDLALTEVAREKAAAPADFNTLMTECWTLLGLGRRDEALADLRAAVNAIPTDYRPSFYPWWFDVVPAGLVLGDHELVLQEIKWAATREPVRNQVRVALRIDPRMAPFRDDPEINALLAEPKKETAPAPPAKAADKSAPADKSVAVLAFANLSDDKANEYFSDGISEELLNVLAKIPGLKVSARTSAFSFKGKNVPIPEIAQQLGVAYVVEGSVRKAGSQVRITAQLIKAADGFHVWSETFTRELKDIFAVQDEIAGLIAQNLRTKMAMARDRPAPAPEVYALVLQARHAAADQTNDGARQAIAFYQQAVTRDPKCADAWAEIALNYVQLGRFGGLPTSDGMREARLAARHALDLETEHPLGLLALAWVQRTNDRDWRGAIESFRRALAAAPENATIMSDAAICFLNVGFVEEALVLAARAAERDPLNARAQWSHGAVLLWSGQPALAVEAYRRAVAVAPTGDEYHSHLSRALAMAGRFPEALKEAQFEPNERYRLVALGTAQYLSGDRIGGDRTLQEIIDKYGDTMAGYLANLCAAAGKIDEAFRWFDRGFDTRDAAMAWVKTNSAFRRLHDDPRWDQFLHKMGLADDQLK